MRKGKKAVVATVKNEPRLQRLALTRDDFLALEFVGRLVGQRAMSGALRFCIEQQAERDQYFGADDAERREYQGRLFGRLPTKEEYRKISKAVRETVGLAQGRLPALGLKEVNTKTELRQWSAWLYPEHDKALDAIGEAWKLGGRIDVIRLSIRIQAALGGFVPTDGRWA